MSCTQHIASSDPMSASGFSPTSTSLQQTGGQSESSSVMGYVLPHQKSGAASVGFGPQHGYMLYPEKRQPTTFIGFNQDQPCLQQSAYCDTQSDVAWGPTPLQKGWNTPTHHHAEQMSLHHFYPVCIDHSQMHNSCTEIGTGQALFYFLQNCYFQNLDIVYCFEVCVFYIENPSCQ